MTDEWEETDEQESLRALVERVKENPGLVEREPGYVPEQNGHEPPPTRLISAVPLSTPPQFRSLIFDKGPFAGFSPFHDGVPESFLVKLSRGKPPDMAQRLFEACEVALRHKRGVILEKDSRPVTAAEAGGRAPASLPTIPNVCGHPFSDVQRESEPEKGTFCISCRRLKELGKTLAPLVETAQHEAVMSAIRAWELTLRSDLQ